MAPARRFQARKTGTSCSAPTTLMVVGVERQMGSDVRVETERHGREHPAHVPVTEADHVAVDVTHPGEHLGGPVRDLVDGLAARDRAGEDRPVRPIAAPCADLFTRVPFEFAVVPLGQVGVDDRVGEARERGRFAGALAAGSPTRARTDAVPVRAPTRALRRGPRR